MAIPRRRLTLALAITLALVVVACSTGGSGGSGGSGGASTAPVATSTVDLPASYRFDPASISVTAGTTVTWTNHDNFSHSVQFLDGGLPAEPLQMQPGASATFTFATPGTYHYLCHLHPQQMRGSVTVTG